MVRSKIIKSTLSLIAATSAHQVAGTASTKQAFLQREEGDDNADNSSKCCNNPVVLYAGAITATAGGIVGGLFGAANCCPDTCSCLSCMRCGGNGGTDPHTGSTPDVDPTRGRGAAARPENFPKDQWPLPHGVTILRETNGVPTIYELSDGSRIEGDNKPVDPTHGHGSSDPRPQCWPKTEPWPLTDGVKIVATSKSHPPIYQLSNGRRVQGVHGHGTAARPEHWPESEPWPLADGLTIVRELKKFPPIYVLSNGREVQGELQSPAPINSGGTCYGFWKSGLDCESPFVRTKKIRKSTFPKAEFHKNCCEMKEVSDPDPVSPVSYPYTYNSVQPDNKVRWLIADHFTGGKKGAHYLKQFRENHAKRGSRMTELISNDWATQNKFTEADIATIAKTSEQEADKKYLQLMLKSKLPRVFAESEGHSRWNKDEFWVMGSVSVVIPVLIYDDGQWFTPQVHPKPFPAYMIFMPGALMNQFSDLTNRQNPNGSINEKKFKQLYELRMLPPLIEANKIAGELGKKAVITLPGIGQGCFANPIQLGVGAVREPFKNAIRGILSDNASKLKNIYLVQYNQHTPDGDENFNASIRQDYNPKDSAADLSNVLHFRRRNSDAGKPSTQQLNLPETYLNENVDNKVLSTHEGKFVLFNIVAWDHLSFPGNDIFPTHGSPGMRNTDDGVKASATNAIQVYQNLGDDYGGYNRQRSMFVPKGHTSWNANTVTDFESLPAKVGGKPLQVEDLTFVDTGIKYD